RLAQKGFGDKLRQDRKAVALGPAGRKLHAALEEILGDRRRPPVLVQDPALRHGLAFGAIETELSRCNGARREIDPDILVPSSRPSEGIGIWGQKRIRASMGRDASPALVIAAAKDHSEHALRRDLLDELAEAPGMANIGQCHRRNLALPGLVG